MTHRDADMTPRSTESSEGANGASAQSAQSNNQTNTQTNNSATTLPKRPRRAPSRASGKKQAQSTQAAPVAQAPAPVSEPAPHQSAPPAAPLAHETRHVAQTAQQPAQQQPAQQQPAQQQPAQQQPAQQQPAQQQPAQQQPAQQQPAQQQPAQQQTQAQAQATTPAEAAPAKSSRTHRGRSSRRRAGAVSIVAPPASEAATKEAATVAQEVDSRAAGSAAPDADLTGTAQPRVALASEARAEERAAATPATFESPAAAADLAAATAEPEWSPTSITGATSGAPVATALAPSATRYRFARHTPAVASQPAEAVRPERLSGRFAASLPGAGGVASPATTQEPAVEQWQTKPAATTAREAQPEAPQTVAPGAVTPKMHVTQPGVPGTAPMETTEGEAALASQLVAAQTGEPPAEPAEPEDHETHDGVTRRRRRRRRAGAASEGAAEEIEGTAHPAGEVAAAGREGGNGFEASYPAGELEPGYMPYAPYTPTPLRTTMEHQPTQYPPYTTGREPGWSITQGQQQLRQAGTPFGSPEPSFTKGFGPQPRGVAQPYRESLARTARPEREAPPISTNQLAQVIGAAFQQQTDRLIAELRRQVTTPPTITVAMPPAQSTERVGVFVDVANLIYSARNMRMSIDFGHLLDFLRGNRRLIRAHAYAPTSPEPHAEQVFLSVVKGVGYRITTKNYKTFSSGAKKADLDLDMCMDIVRLVEAGAIDSVVLVSGDSDFLPVLEWASDKGVRIEVAAFEDAASTVLRQSCDLFVNLSLVPDIRL